MAVIDSVKLPDNSTYEVADNHSGYQKETLTTPITINGTQKTTVEGALGGLNDYGDALADNLSANEESGAKNQNVYPYKDTTKTENGVTFTDNGDGTITVSAASYPYTVSSDTTFYCSYFLDNEFKAGTWTLNGSPVVSDDVFVGYVVHYGGEYLSYLDKGQEVTFTQAVDTDDVAIVIALKSGYVLAGALLFKPMLRDARILDDMFVPYAETNLQLTQNKADRDDLATINITGSTNNTGSTIAKNTLFYLNGSLCRATEYIMNGDTFTLNTNFKVINIGSELYGESGTFTLTPTGGTYTDGFTSQTNNYVRVGGLCLIFGYLELAGNPDSSHTYVTCSGLPFLSNSDGELGFSVIRNNGKVADGVLHNGAGSINIYFDLADGTYPTAGQLYNYTLMIRVY